MSTIQELYDDLEMLKKMADKEAAELTRRHEISETEEEMCRLCSPVIRRIAAVCEQYTEALRRFSKVLDEEEARLSKEKKLWNS